MNTAGIPERAGPLSYRPYAYFWYSRLAATLAMQIQVVAVGWQIYELTGSALDLGLVGLVQFAPSVLLLFVVGPIVDRGNRRTILALCRLSNAIATLALAVASVNGWLTREALFVFVFALGAARAFEMPAGQALLPTLVPSTMLPRAIALASSAIQAATIVGPAIGGFLYVAGPHVVYASAAAMYLVGAVTMLWVQDRREPGSLPQVSVRYLFAGIGFIRRHPILLGAISLDMVAVLLGGATALLPIYARDILMTGPWGLGLLRSAPGVGALVMALWLSRRPPQRRVGRALLGSVALFGVATLVFGVSRSLPLSLCALVVLGAADMVSVVIRMSLVQLETPDAMRGRVGAVNSVFIGASNQIGEFESGAVAAWLGVVASVVIGGVGTLLVVALWARLFPELARRDQLAPRS